MCGRYTLRARLNRLLEIYAAQSQIEWEPHYNIAPTQNVVGIRHAADGDHREAVLLRWGLIPPWAGDPTIGNRMINARAETIAEKRSFISPLKRRRCLVIADGFYEWKKEGKAKQPYYIHMKDDQPIAFAGLWERWKKNDLTIESCTIITTAANELMAPLHDRMPAILSPIDFEKWLDPTIEDPDQLTPLLDSYPADEMEAYPVSTAVNSSKGDSSDYVHPTDTQ
ncbi:SOS response-associated peptidase [Blastopirellula marina]|uniref:Abasic site processing protein n=1 Tax=Blastopirellula marina TaxID=124 RepID=A0A2S8F9V5_9BACT|nr:SOS response-associated peptidase [Blastopirellula marina]PQO28948.1 hypothetical protein C5Y98_24630 [Blastopirellula marina]PTL42221.1 SOS response-associated peptidase [Blastopirellula marina]